MSLHLFNKQQEMVKRIGKEDILVAEQTIEINVVDSLYVELPLDMWSKLPEKPVYMGVQDVNDRYSYYQYRIAEEDIHVDTVSLRGIQIGYDELKAKGYVREQSFKQASVSSVLEYILKGSGWELSFVDTSFGNISVELETTSRLEALRKVLDLFGAEIVFKTAVSGNRISSKRIDVFRELGGFKGKRFTYGDNVLNVVKEESTAELYTALVPIGKEVPKYPDEKEAAGQDEEMVKMSIKDVTWVTSAGDPINKPRGQEYVELEKATTLYGYTNTTPRIGIYEDTSAETPEELLHNAYEALQEASRPKVQFKATVGSIGDLDIGETVAIVRPELEFRYKTRVFKIVRNLLDNEVSELEFGDVLTRSPYQRYKDFTTSQDKVKEELEGSIRDTADGKNKIFRGEQEPTEGMVKGDLWYRPLLNGEVEMYQYDGERWVLIVSSAGNDYVDIALDEANDRIQDARDYTDELRKTADSILAGLGVGKIEDVHQDIVTGILENVGDRMSGIDSTIDRVSGETYQLIFDIQENPAGHLVGYNEVEERSDLYKRVIGEDEAGIQSKVSRIVMGSGLVQSEVANQTSGYSTRFYQIENSFSMSITDRDRIVTEINASDKGVYVKGKYITLDSDVDVAGDFTIQGSAVVGELDANIITTGTLNAGRINVINFNADSISTGTLKAHLINAVGGWSVSQYLYSSTPYGYTTLKPGGEVAIGIGSPTHDSTTNANLQIWHSGRIRFGNSSSAIERDMGNSSLNLTGHTDINLMPSADVTVMGALRPRTQGTGDTLGTTSYRWRKIYATSDSWDTGSDIRYKRDITDMPDTFYEVFSKEVEPKRFEENGHTQFGYLAQDVERALFKYGSSLPENTSLKDINEYVSSFGLLSKGESYMSLVYPQVAVIKEQALQQQVDTLSDKIRLLEERLNG